MFLPNYTFIRYFFFSYVAGSYPESMCEVDREC